MFFLIACATICSALLYESSSKRGFTESCICCERGECDKVPRNAPPSMPITGKFKKQPEAEPEREDPRPVRNYDDE